MLNNCLDEIVYFFSRSKSKIVVFEDLDRLGNTEVFIKLREINQIVNNNLKVDPVRFVYACRDDIFLGSDIRTKFFDFILPVVPVLDTRNAYTHLKNKLKGFPAAHDVLLKQLSLYISDMRSLQNMANEFNLFRKIVDENKNEAKIFAIIFYKNIYSQDYNLTDKKAGVLYSIVNDYRRRKLHEKYFISLDDKKDKLYARLEKLKKKKHLPLLTCEWRLFVGFYLGSYGRDYISQIMILESIIEKYLAPPKCIMMKVVSLISLVLDQRFMLGTMNVVIITLIVFRLMSEMLLMSIKKEQN